MHKMHRAGVDNYVTYPKGKIRKLTPRECLRLQSFPDSFKMSPDDRVTYKQAGNSVNVDNVSNVIESTFIHYKIQYSKLAPAEATDDA